jgi:hypothetical protein
LSKLAFRILIEVVEKSTEHAMEVSQRLSLQSPQTLDRHKYRGLTGLGNWKANDLKSTFDMWTRSDILALLQLLTMIILAMLHALWYLFVQGKSPKVFDVPIG